MLTILLSLIDESARAVDLFQNLFSYILISSIWSWQSLLKTCTIYGNLNSGSDKPLPVNIKFYSALLVSTQHTVTGTLPFDSPSMEGIAIVE